MENKSIYDLLKEVWGYTSFRPVQEDIIQAILEKRDVLALLPTGGGKSICFQIPALASEGIALIISPLIALMKDQVGQLKSRNIPADALHSGQSFTDHRRILDNALNGHLKMLYISPERLKSERFREILPHLNISFIAIDEAHCISQWGYDFRPSYLSIKEVRSGNPQIPMLALTATATPEVARDICVELDFTKEASVFNSEMSRPNLAFSSYRNKSKWQLLTRLLSNDSGSSIVYTRSRKKTADVARSLSNEGLSVTFYHAGLDYAEREVRQKEWINGDRKIIVATNAFGMGIDKSDVRNVIHLDVPDTLEAYTQEAGRAGRDGLPARAIILFGDLDVSRAEKRIEQSYPSLDIVKRVYQALGSYYQLAVGSISDKGFEFDMLEFCRRFGLRPLDVHNALRILEKEGWLILMGELKKPAVFKIIANEEAVIGHIHAKRSHHLLLQSLLRLHEGAFFQRVKLNWDSLIRISDLSKKSVFSGLAYLSELKLIDFRPMSSQEGIVFMRSRVMADNLVLNWGLQRELKSRAKARWKDMMTFLNTTNCRAQYIERYFGSESSGNCGMCDNCLEADRGKRIDGDLKSLLIKRLQSGDRTVDELIEIFEPAREKEVLTVLDSLSKEERIFFSQGKIAWKHESK